MAKTLNYCIGMIKYCLILGILLKTCATDVLESIPVHHSDIDNFDNTYFFNDKQEIEKQTIGDTTKRIFSLSNYGNDPIVDASFPLEVALFFYHNGSLVLLDNQLNILEEVNFYKSNPISVSHFGRSVEGMFWVFNQNTRTLQKLNRDGSLVIESNIINNISGNGIQRIHDLGTEVYLQNGLDLLKFSPSLKYLNTEKNTQLLRCYKFPVKITNGQLKYKYGKKEITKEIHLDSIPIGISKNKYVLHGKNGLILQAID